MKNFQKLVFGLMVAGMAIGFSAFTNAPAKGKFTTWYYGYVKTSPTTFVYQRLGSSIPSLTPCSPAATNICVISYPSDQGSTLDPAALPTGSSNFSHSNGLYVQ